jgi:hypothetical protein
LKRSMHISSLHQRMKSSMSSAMSAFKHHSTENDHIGIEPST